MKRAKRRAVLAAERRLCILFCIERSAAGGYNVNGSGGARFFSGHPLLHLLGVAARIKLAPLTLRLQGVGFF
jgi:hypothetical protein